MKEDMIPELKMIRHPEESYSTSKIMRNNAKSTRMNFLEQLDMKRKYFKSSYQTTAISREITEPSSNISKLVDHNSDTTKSLKSKKFLPKQKKMFNKMSIRDLISNEHVNSFVFPDIKHSRIRNADASHLTGFTSGTGEEIPSQINDQTIEYYS
jgi:hypothetical protein